MAFLLLGRKRLASNLSNCLPFLAHIDEAELEAWRLGPTCWIDVWVIAYPVGLLWCLPVAVMLSNILVDLLPYRLFTRSFRLDDAWTDVLTATS